MREIKFRAWNKLEKRMEDVNFIKFFQNAYTMVSTRYRDEKSKKLYDDQFAYGQEDGSDNVILMQYTGLKDKHGMEIYEGDIVVVTYKDMRTDTGLVVFKGCGFKVEIPNVGDDELVDWERYSDSIEVVGNIHDNPELLEGDK